MTKASAKLSLAHLEFTIEYEDSNWTLIEDDGGHHHLNKQEIIELRNALNLLLGFADDFRGKSIL